jgi:coenzyme Q-binding protein COQ10
MAVHRESRQLPYAPEQIFDLVADVEAYPRFLPMWHSASVRRPPTKQQIDIYHTEQTLQLGPLQKKFRTETRLERPSRIDVSSTDPLFSHFSMQWGFEPQSDEACLVEFSLRCEASSFLLRPLLEVLLLETTHGIIQAFEQRAHKLYGGS